MLQRYFYIYVIVAGISIIFCIMLIMTEVKGDFNLLRAFMKVLIPVLVLLVLRFIFINKSSTKKVYTENKKQEHISNIDLVDWK